MAIIFFSGDLMFGSRVEFAASSAGRSMTTVRNQSHLAEAIRELDEADEPISHVLVDLEDPNAKPGEIAAAIQAAAPTATLIGYAGHLKVDLLKAARDAGFAASLSKGQFNEQMRDLLK